MIFKAILMCLLDYLLAYTMMGLGGIFRDKIKNPGTSLMCGSLVALGARYLTHILSGYLLFSGWAEWFFTQDGFPAWGAKLVESLSPVALGLGLFHCVQRLLHGSRADPHRHRGAADRTNPEDRGQG